MTWEELYPIVKEQAYYAVLRYEEPERRKDKIQELVCQAYELYKSYIERGKPIKKQDFKCFISQRVKEVDKRSICKSGKGGNSIIDVLSFYRRRPDSTTQVCRFDDWMTFDNRTKNVDDTFAFNIDFHDWLAKLNKLQKQILNYLIQGYKTSKIAEMIRSTSSKVKQIINQLQELFVGYFVCA